MEERERVWTCVRENVRRKRRFWWEKQAQIFDYTMKSVFEPRIAISRG